VRLADSSSLVPSRCPATAAAGFHRLLGGQGAAQEGLGYPDERSLIAAGAGRDICGRRSAPPPYEPLPERRATGVQRRVPIGIPGG
jgi:hypothetical protein